MQPRFVVAIDDLAQAQLDGHLPLIDDEGRGIDEQGQEGQPDRGEDFHLRIHQRSLRSRATSRLSFLGAWA